MAKLGTFIGLGILGAGTVAILRKREASRTAPGATPLGAGLQSEGTGEPPDGEPEPEPPGPLNPPPGPEGQGEPPFVPPEPQPPQGGFGGPTFPGHHGPGLPPPPLPIPQPQPQPGVFGEPMGPGHVGLHCDPISISGAKLTDLVHYDEMTQVEIVIEGFKAQCNYQLTMAFCLATNQATFGWIDQFAETNFGPGQGGVPKEYGIKDYQWSGDQQFGGPALYTPMPKKFRLHYAYKRRYEVRVHTDAQGNIHLSNKKAYTVTNGSATDACPAFVNPWPKPTIGDQFYIPGTAGPFGSPATVWKPKPKISWVRNGSQLKLRVSVAGIPHFGAQNGKPYLEPYETTRYKVFYAVHAQVVA